MKKTYAPFEMVPMGTLTDSEWSRKQWRETAYEYEAKNLELKEDMKVLEASLMETLEAKKRLEGELEDAQRFEANANYWFDEYTRMNSSRAALATKVATLMADNQKLKDDLEWMKKDLGAAEARGEEMTKSKTFWMNEESRQWMSRQDALRENSKLQDGLKAAEGKLKAIAEDIKGYGNGSTGVSGYHADSWKLLYKVYNTVTGSDYYVDEYGKTAEDLGVSL